MVSSSYPSMITILDTSQLTEGTFNLFIQKLTSFQKLQQPVVANVMLEDPYRGE